MKITTRCLFPISSFYCREENYTDFIDYINDVVYQNTKNMKFEYNGTVHLFGKIKVVFDIDNLIDEHSGMAEIFIKIFPLGEQYENKDDYPIYEHLWYDNFDFEDDILNYLSEKLKEVVHTINDVIKDIKYPENTEFYFNSSREYMYVEVNPLHPYLPDFKSVTVSDTVDTQILCENLEVWDE